MMQGTVTAAFSSDLLPNNLFFGIQENNSLKLMVQSGEINMAGAHNGPITAIEFTQYGGQEVVFTASTDGVLKAW